MLKLFSSVLMSLILMNTSSIISMKRALIWAAQLGDLTVAKKLLHRGADINVRDNNGHTALMLAASRGHLDVGKELLNRGADINARDNNGNTALMLAAQSGHLEIVKELLIRNADIDDITESVIGIKSNIAIVLDDLNRLKRDLIKNTLSPTEALEDQLKDGNSFLVKYLLRKYMFDLNKLKDLIQIATNKHAEEQDGLKKNKYNEIVELLKAQLKTKFEQTLAAPSITFDR